MDNECYERRMFNHPYIDQIAARLPFVSRSKQQKCYSTYHDEIGKVGSLIMKHNLHDHSQCGKLGIKCEHKITELNRRARMN